MLLHVCLVECCAGADGTVYIGANDNNLYALDGLKGTLKWNFTTGNVVYSSPAIGALRLIDVRPSVRCVVRRCSVMVVCVQARTERCTLVSPFLTWFSVGLVPLLFALVPFAAR